MCPSNREVVNRDSASFLDALYHAAPEEMLDPVQAEKGLSSYLLEPLFYVPFGHADCLPLVLRDDFYPIQHLPANVNTRVEEARLASCPSTDSLGVAVADSSKVFCDLHTHLQWDEAARCDLGDLAFQQNALLLVLTEYEMDSFGTVGYALPCEQTLLRATAIEINAAKDRPYEKLASSVFAGLMCERDVEPVRCAFLDVQGAEELGTLVLCRNYSVAIYLASRTECKAVAQVLLHTFYAVAISASGPGSIISLIAGHVPAYTDVPGRGMSRGDPYGKHEPESGRSETGDRYEASTADKSRV